jgi:peptidoglycan/LPS O-acetylase OafA/YrhL
MTKLFNFNSNRLHGLDHLRAIAIILVMFHHYGAGIPSWLVPLKQIGWSGVDLFFVLSGYLIGYQLLSEYKKTGGINFKHFYLKRFFRIIPVYVATLIFYFSLPNLIEGTGLPPLWRFLTFTQNFGLDVQTQKSFSHAWSLCIEEQFYLALPFSIVAIFTTRIQRGTPYLIVGLVVLGFMLRIYNWNEYVQPFVVSEDRRQVIFGFLENVYYPSYTRMDGLITGVSIAVIFNFKPKIKEYFSTHGNFVLLLGIGLFLIAYKVCENLISFRTSIFGFPLISLAYGFFVIAAISPTCILYKIKSRFTLIIATLSYSIYLTHKQLFHLVKLWVNGLENESIQQWTFLICLLIAIIGGMVLHLVIEKPFLRLRYKIIKKDKPL